MFIYSKSDFINVHLLFRYSIGRYQNGTRSLILHLPLRLRRSGDFSGCKFKILRSQPHIRLEIKKSWKKLLSLFLIFSLLLKSYQITFNDKILKRILIRSNNDSTDYFDRIMAYLAIINPQ